MLESWRTAWARSRERHQDQVALLAAEGALSFGELGEKADHWRSHYETLPSWCVGQCQSWAWRGAWIDLPQLMGLWLAGGVWIAQDSDSSHADLAESIASSIRGPASGEGHWQQILFSSGSTGRPKVLVRGWRQALLEAKANARQLQLPPGSRCAMVVNPWFGAATKHLLAGLLEGWCQVIWLCCPMEANCSTPHRASFRVSEHAANVWVGSSGSRSRAKPAQSTCGRSFRHGHNRADSASMPLAPAKSA
jgi:non-ribosomal peptide synthetase component F